MEFKEFGIECRRLFKIFINNSERSSKFGKDVELNAFFGVSSKERTKQKEQQYLSEKNKENERKEIIKDTLKVSIKLRNKLKLQTELLTDKSDLDEKLVLDTLKKFLNKNEKVKK